MNLIHDFRKSHYLSCNLLFFSLNSWILHYLSSNLLLFTLQFLKIRLVAQVPQEGSRRGSRQPDVRDFLTVWGLALES